MMTTNKNAAMANHCDKLTQNGEELAITWDGGGDSGYFEMLLDGKPIEHTGTIENEVIQLVADHIGYGSFDGDFSASGKVKYDRENKCFEGTDRYLTSEQETHACEIPVIVPGDVWFDRLDIRVEENEQDELFVTAAFFMVNGPCTDEHHRCERIIEEQLAELIGDEIIHIDPYHGITELFQIEFREFSQTGDQVVHVLKEFEYQYEDTITKHIHIPLTQKINTDENK